MTEVDATALSFTFTFCFLSLLFASPELEAAPKPFYCKGHPPVLWCQTLLLKRANASDPFLNIQIIAILILSSLKPFFFSQMAHKSIIYLEGPDKLCYSQIILASVFLWVLKVHVTVKQSVETIENELILSGKKDKYCMILLIYEI